MSSSLAPKEEATNAISFWTTTTRLRLDAVKTSAPNRRRRQEMLKLEIEALRNAVDSANRLYNSQTGICSLPPETLSEIFAYVKAVWSPSRTTYHTEESVTFGSREDAERSRRLADLAICRSGWMSLSHVCTHWREILLNAPNFWKSHENCLEIGLGWTSRIITRSRTLPLDLTFNMRTKSINVDFELADPSLFAWITRSVSPRIKRISFVDCVPTFSSNACGEVTVDLPMVILEELHIDVAFLRGQSRLWANDRLALVMRKWTHNTAPRLRNLTLLCDRSVYWNSSIFSKGLTNLHIELPTESLPAQIPSYHNIASLLRSCTSLEYLTLRNAIPTAATDIPPIALAHTLQYLELGSERRTNHCVKFLQHLTSTIPNGCTVGIDLNLRHERNREALLDGPLRQAFTHLWNLAPPRELVICLGRYVMFPAVQPRERWGTYHQILHWREHGPQQDAAILDIDACPQDWNFFENERTPDLSTLEALSIYNSGYGSTKNFLDETARAHLASAVNVKRIGVEFDRRGPRSALSLLECLSELSSDSGSTSTFKLCPKFDTLVLTGDPYDLLRGRWRPVDAHPLSIEMLKFLVQERKKHGVPIKEFFVHASMCGWEIWESLKEDAIVTFWR